jgi:tRNA modification GTPase
MATSPDTIAALATPQGTSAIALLRVSGPGVRPLRAELFGDGAPPRQVQRADYRDRRGELIDDVLYTWFAGPHSYTGEDSLEISCHGNPIIALKLREDLFARGCRPAEPGEFTRRAFLNGRMDLSQAEAVMDLIHARSERALSAANQQLRGALSRRMEALIDRALQCQARVEAYIDFPEEDLPPEDRSGLLESLRELARETERLLATSQYGEMLRTGIKTVILGEPNAGKSSLLNALLGQERALVSPEPGTTRDYLTETLNVGPHSLRLIDTAGLNMYPTVMEKRGMAKTLEQVEEANLFIWVIDTTEELYPLPEKVRSRMKAENTLVLLNKIDLKPKEPRAYDVPYPTLRISVTQGTGLELVKEKISALADGMAKAADEEHVAISARHALALGQAKEGLKAAIEKMENNHPGLELIASDLRSVVAAYGDISGRIDNERMLDRLFASFCIGK